jgi:hypothetical protein
MNLYREHPQVVVPQDVQSVSIRPTIQRYKARIGHY